MNLLFGIYTFVVGAACGSFALVLADRMHAGRDWVRGRSVCDHCSHTLGPIDLIPIASWMIQSGKCRYCNKKLSAFYPMVELGTGLAFLSSYLLTPYELTGLYIVMGLLWLVGLVIMAALVVADVKWFLLPSKLVLPLIGVAGVHRAVEVMVEKQGIVDAIVSTSAAIVVGAGLFWALHRASKGKWIGDGDYRLGVAIGLFLGNPITTWMSLFFASVLGLALALPLMIRAKSRRKVKIPFGPFLILGLGVSYLVGDQLVQWYTDAFLYL